MWRLLALGCVRLPDVIADVGQLTAPEELMEYLPRLAVSLGYWGAAYYRLSRLGSPVDPTLVFGEAFDAWVSHYAAQNFATRDPVVPTIFRRDDPFTVLEIEAAFPKPAEVHADRKALWAPDGLFCPVFASWSEVGAFCWASDDILTLGPQDRLAMSAISSILVTTFNQFEIEAVLPGLGIMPLSPREAECAFWLSQGLRAQEIAARLSLSIHTVRQYIATATERLGARNPGQMVMRASSLGLIARR